MAAGTRTAPTINGTPAYQLASFTFIDASTDVRSIAIQGPAGATNAQWEAIAAALQAVSQASLGVVNVQFIYDGGLSAGNAVAGDRGSVFDNVTMLWKNSTRVSRDVFIPAPASEIMNGDLDDVNLTATELLALNAAVLAVSSGFTVRSARFTERKEINKRQKY